MYTQLRQSLSVVAHSERRVSHLGGRLLGEGVDRNVVHLGVTSLFTDVSSEMISTILPIYLLFYLQLSPLQFGALDGLYQGASALVRVGGGVAADRWQRYKEVAVVGYALSAASKVAMLAAGPVWGALVAIVVVDRTGKGIRTAPRDALISLSSSSRSLGVAFGVHRALDTAGAMLGPLAAFAILTALPNAFDVVFIASFCAAVVGLAVLALFVENRSPRPETMGNTSRLTWVHVVAMMRQPGIRSLTILGSVLALATISDGFVYLVLQRRLTFNTSYLPLLYVGTSLVYFLLAIPIGRLADRIGRKRVFVGGYTLLLVVYVVMLLPSMGTAELLAALILFGSYYAATDGILMTLATEVLDPDIRTSGMALLTTATGFASLFASLVFGGLWTVWGPDTATVLFLLGLALALIGAIVLIMRVGGWVPSGGLRAESTASANS